MNAITFTVQLALALVFGGMIGAERQWRQRMAGLRTNALVSSGAAMFVLGARLMGAPTDSVLRARLLERTQTVNGDRTGLFLCTVVCRSEDEAHLARTEADPREPARPGASGRGARATIS